MLHPRCCFKKDVFCHSRSRCWPVLDLYYPPSGVDQVGKGLLTVGWGGWGRGQSTPVIHGRKAASCGRGTGWQSVVPTLPIDTSAWKHVDVTDSGQDIISVRARGRVCYS